MTIIKSIFMLNLVSNPLSLVARNARRNLHLARPLARFSTAKGENGEKGEKGEEGEKGEQPKDPETQQTKAQEEKHIDTDKLLEKYNKLTARVADLKEEADNLKQFDEKRTQFRSLTQELNEGRAKITSLIAEGERTWAKTRERIGETEDKQCIEFGRELVKFSRTLTELERIKPTAEQEPLIEGLQMTQRILLGTLQKFHFRPFEPLNEKFNPSSHTRVNDKDKGGVVSEVVEPGWTHKNKVVIPAKVTTGK